MPARPPCLKGVVNLRGLIVPIADLRIKFNLGEPVCDRFTGALILRPAARTIGMVLGSVPDLIAVGRQDSKPAPEMDGALATDCILGLGAFHERMVTLVDINRLLSGTELGLAQGYAA